MKSTGKSSQNFQKLESDLFSREEFPCNRMRNHQRELNIAVYSFGAKTVQQEIVLWQQYPEYRHLQRHIFLPTKSL